MGASELVRSAVAAMTTFDRPPGGWNREVIDRLDARPAVVAFEDAEGRTQMLGTCADARAFCGARLLGAVPGRADLGAVTFRVHLAHVRSGFEADLVFLDVARGRLGRVYAQAMARAAMSVVRVPMADRLPEPGALDLERAAGEEPASVVGPVSRAKGTALADAIIDAFDLCRYPLVLRQSPSGTACAYKEMGRCPAPCDGSEAQTSYQARVRAAVAELRLPGERRGGELGAAIRDAASAGEYERAAALKQRLDRLAGLASGAFQGVGTFDTFRHVVLTGGGSKGGAVCLTGWVGGRQVGGEFGPGASAELVGRLLSETVTMPGCASELEAVGVLMRWTRESARRLVRVVRVDDAGAVELVDAAARSLARSKGGDRQGEVQDAEHTGA